MESRRERFCFLQCQFGVSAIVTAKKIVDEVGTLDRKDDLRPLHQLLFVETLLFLCGWYKRLRECADGASNFTAKTPLQVLISSSRPLQNVVQQRRSDIPGVA